MRTVSVSARSGISLYRIMGRSLPCVEIYQQSFLPRVHPVNFYQLAGVFGVPLQWWTPSALTPFRDTLLIHPLL